MTVELLVQIYGAFLLSVVVGMAFGVRILRPDGKTYTPQINVEKPVFISKKTVENMRHDFRDDAQEIMQMLKRKYKNKDSIRKAKNVVDHIYQMYGNRCKKCTK